MAIISGDTSNYSAYGGKGWSIRENSLLEDIGKIWHPCGNNCEFSRLKSVLLHKPGKELEQSKDPNEIQMIGFIDPSKAQKQHDNLVGVYRENNVSVHYVNPATSVYPNLMFVADLMFMTPEGVIICRPASRVRAGEERWVSMSLAGIGIPVIYTVRGAATFEGADAVWLNSKTVLIGRGLRTNLEGIQQVSSILKAMDVDTIKVDLPTGAMHLMGLLRFIDHDIAVAWPGRIAVSAADELKNCGYSLKFLPSEKEAKEKLAFNFVTLGPKKVLMPEGNPETQTFLENLGVECVTVNVDEIIKGAGAVGCLTGVVSRELIF